MTYQEAVEACRAGSVVNDGKTEAKAVRIMVLFGQDYIKTDGKFAYEVRRASVGAL